MPKLLTPVAAFDAVNVPLGSEPHTAASAEAPWQDLTNRTAYLAAHAPGASDVADKYLPISGAMRSSSNHDKWSGDANGWSQIDVSTAAAIVIDLDVPVGATLTAIKAYVIAFGHGALPATMPTIQLVEYNVDADTYTDLGSQVDTAASVGAYQAVHAITLALSDVVVAGKRYALIFTGETGANSVINTRLTGVRASWTRPADV